MWYKFWYFKNSKTQVVSFWLMFIEGSLKLSHAIECIFASACEHLEIWSILFTKVQPREFPYLSLSHIFLCGNVFFSLGSIYSQPLCISQNPRIHIGCSFFWDTCQVWNILGQVFLSNPVSWGWAGKPR